MFTVGKYIIKNLVQKNPLDLSDQESVQNRSISLAHPMHHPGFTRAYASTALYFPLTGMHACFERVGSMYGNRVFVIWVIA